MCDGGQNDEVTKLTSTSERMECSQDVVAELEQLVQEDGFVLTFCGLVYASIWMYPSDVATVDWHERPNMQELAFLLGLMVKREWDLERELSEDDAIRQFNMAVELLKRLHDTQSMRHRESSDNTEVDSERHDEASDQFEDWATTIEAWRNSREHVVEPAFYGHAGAYDFQYLDYAEAKYSKDAPWLKSHKEIEIGACVQIAKLLKALVKSRTQSLQPTNSFVEHCTRLFEAFVFSEHDVQVATSDYVDEFLDVFSIEPGSVNSEFENLGQYNAVHSHPLIRISSDRYFLPMTFYLTETIYKSPFYWMSDDEDYVDEAFKHRGEINEEIVTELIEGIYGSANTFGSVKIMKGKNVYSEIDVLVVCGTQAIVFQIKSKQMTEDARVGDNSRVNEDFSLAVQKAYTQGLKCRKALMSSGYRFVNNEGRAIHLPGPYFDPLVVCIAGDEYPALPFQVQWLLEKTARDPEPMVTTVFDLRLICYYLDNPIDFLYYVRQRSRLAGYCVADSELALLEFHLEQNFAAREGCDVLVVSPGYGRRLDANFLALHDADHYDSEAEKMQLEWRIGAVNDVVARIQQLGGLRYLDAVFFVFALVGNNFDNLLLRLEDLKESAAEKNRVGLLTFYFTFGDRGLSSLVFLVIMIMH